MTHEDILTPLGDIRLHFEDAEVLANVQDSEYAKGNIQRHLNFMTCNEKWSLYRAIVKLAEAKSAVGYPSLSDEADNLKTMDICSPLGSKVMFAFPMNGSDYDKEYAGRFLRRGEIYTLLEIKAGLSYTLVCLEEHPNRYFKSVAFSNVKD